MSGARALSMVVALVPLTGCLVTGVIDPAGGGRFTVKTHLVSVAHFEPMKAALQSSDVILKSASMTPDKWATFEFECVDVRKLSTAPAFAGADILVTEGPKGERTVTATLANAAPDRMSDAFANYLGRDFDVSMQLPGEVTHSNAMATAGRTVAWKWPVAELSHHRHKVISASYRLS